MKERKVFESVPGKQVTIAHIISNPSKILFEKLGFAPTDFNAIGILTITPSDVSIIAVDFAKKEAGIKIGFIDRFSGSMCIIGDVSAVEASINKVLLELQKLMNFSVCSITRS
ncbi:BMC domain-containing protein [Streptococcus pluranimalium]|uniref:Propanediol utilization protein PduU n=1 Tax=Streptococcus pluranimalium TaxID=82348 RepID=A0A345VM96_9STRE|nr:BMC domain-containing protein [Streptococcus pluranimalium]AXJ13848.1 Propanediol utilization protein PduU [Streptococcus pluranimalium]